MENKMRLPEDRLIICRCEEITRSEIESAIREGYITINEIRKRTRAGMGLCQGKICGRIVRQIIEEKTGLRVESILPARARPPVRPIKGEVFAKGSDEL